MKKNIFLSLHILSHSPLRDARQKVKAGNWKQELKEKPWMNATIGLFIHDLISLLSYTYRRFHTWPKHDTSHSELGPSTSIPNPENSHRTLVQRHFLDCIPSSQITIVSVKLRGKKQPGQTESTLVLVIKNYEWHLQNY